MSKYKLTFQIMLWEHRGWFWSTGSKTDSPNSILFQNLFNFMTVHPANGKVLFSDASHFIFKTFFSFKDI
jgi:hypothetical protein